MLHPHACSNDLKTVRTALRSFPMLGHLVGDQDIKTHHVFLDAKTISMQTNTDKQNKAKKKTTTTRTTTLLQFAMPTSQCLR